MQGTFCFPPAPGREAQVDALEPCAGHSRAGFRALGRSGRARGTQERNRTRPDRSERAPVFATT